MYEQPLRHSLGLLSVNKQIFDEAYAYFYRMNIFALPNVTTMGEFLRNLPPSRRQHLTQLAFEYLPSDRNAAPSAIHYLASLKNLKRLYINFDSDYWSVHSKFSASLQWDGTMIRRIPGFTSLSKIRGLDHVEIDGLNPVIAAQIKDAMEGKSLEKRRAADKEMKDWRRPGRVAKSRKMGTN
jgi:hypothetical protein